MFRSCLPLALALTLPFAGPTRAAEHEAHAEHFKKCAKVCADCRLECDSCFKHCVTMVAGGKKEHAATVQLCADCAAVCQLCSTLCARSSPLAAHSLEACAKSCEQCGAACAKFPDDEHMARCAKVCRDCAKECREMVKHLGGQAAK